MINRKEMSKITGEQRRLVDKEYILDEEKFNMMNRKERREFLKEHKKNKKRLKF